jgi:hypothetical protein
VLFPGDALAQTKGLEWSRTRRSFSSGPSTFAEFGASQYFTRAVWGGHTPPGVRPPQRRSNDDRTDGHASTHKPSLEKLNLATGCLSGSRVLVSGQTVGIPAIKKDNIGLAVPVPHAP